MLGTGSYREGVPEALTSRTWWKTNALTTLGRPHFSGFGMGPQDSVSALGRLSSKPTGLGGNSCLQSKAHQSPTFTIPS